MFLSDKARLILKNFALFLNEENNPLKNQLWVFVLTNSHPSTAKDLIETVGYVCTESLKCDDCVCQTMRDELTFSPVDTLAHD